MAPKCLLRSLVIRKKRDINSLERALGAKERKEEEVKGKQGEKEEKEE